MATNGESDNLINPLDQLANPTLGDLADLDSAFNKRMADIEADPYVAPEVLDEETALYLDAWAQVEGDIITGKYSTP